MFNAVLGAIPIDGTIPLVEGPALYGVELTGPEGAIPPGGETTSAGCDGAL